MKGYDQSWRTAVMVETLIAVALLAVAFNFLVRFAFSGPQQALAAETRARAVLLAQEKMEALVRHIDDIPQWKDEIAERYPLEEESGFYVLPDDDGALRWRWDTSPYQGAEGLIELSVRVVSVGPPSRRNKREEVFSLSTLLARPSGLPHGEEVSE